MIGQTISHYRILEKLGEGGMGVVYKAQDTRLDRVIAIKFLPAHMSADSEARKRFESEAKSASALDHPNICTIHEIDETPDGATFIVMACYEGQTLREIIDEGPLGIDRAVDIALQLSSGLAKAHDKGIVHRDIKPANIFLTSDGHLKILDFGIAKLEGATRITREGSTLGTARYMSPEQAKGEETGPETDVWATGVILYEMLTGKPPFKGEYDPAVLYSILNEAPGSIKEIRQDVPPSLEGLIEKALNKDKADRFATAGELKSALDAEAAGTGTGSATRHIPGTYKFRRSKAAVFGMLAVLAVAIIVTTALVMKNKSDSIDSLAVLPFDNISQVDEYDIFAEGITGELISSLNKIGTFSKVTSRASSIRYKGSDKSPETIAGELGVKGLVGGWIQIQGDDVHLGVELIDGKSGQVLWSNEFDGGMRDLFALQSRIVREIVLDVTGSLTEEEKGNLDTDREIDPEAYEAYLWGVKYEELWNTERRVKAIESFEKAISIDSTFADAYAWLSFCYASGMVGDNEDFDRAERYAREALELEPRSALAHEAFGWLLLYRDWDWKGAAEQMRIARRYSAGGYGIIMQGFYNISGDEETALQLARRSVEDDPLNPMQYQRLAYSLMCFQRPDEALGVYREVLERFETTEVNVWEWIAYIYAQKGMPDSSLAIAEREGLDTSHWHLWDWVYGAAGMEGIALRHLEQYEALYPGVDLSPQIALIYAVTGDREKSFQWMERAYENHNNWLLYMNAMAGFGIADNLLDDPRWDDMTSRIGFPKGNWTKRRTELERRQKEGEDLTGVES